MPDGIDTWRGFDILVPIDRVTLVSKTALDVLNITLKFFVEVWDPTGGVISSPTTLFERAQVFMGAPHVFSHCAFYFFDCDFTLILFMTH